MEPSHGYLHHDYNHSLRQYNQPLHGALPETLEVTGGRISSKKDPSKSEAIKDLLSRNGGKPVETEGSAEPSEDHSSYSEYCWGAVFAEVAVDKTTYMTKVRRIVATYDIGTLYRLALEKAPAGSTLHGVGDTGLACV